jgi:BirA family biotin operon repressor/biotin-[acetyl-CoA-carboxylase] ligase
MPEVFHASTLLHRLEGLRFGHPIYLYLQIGSTNDEAKRLAEGGAPEGLLVVAEEQTAGKGRLGRQWLTPPGAALALSVILRPALPTLRAMRLTMLAGLAVCEAVQQVAGLAAQLKWPNDVLINGKKAGGILVEGGLVNDQLTYAVVGIGLNVSFVPDPASVEFPATSLNAEAGREIDRARLLRAILAALESRYPQLLANDPALAQAWAARLTLLHTPITLHSAEGVWHGQATGVDDDGALLLQLETGETRRILAGDVKLRPA